MSLIFDWDARKGTLIDSVSKTVGTLIGTDIEFKKIEKGLSLRNENISSLNTNISLSLGTGDNTIVFANKFKGDGNNGAFIAQYDNSNNGFDFAIRSNNHFEFYYRNTSVNLTPLLSATKYYGRTNLFIIIRKGTTVYTYINNELVSTKTGVTNDLTNNSNLFIGSRVEGNFCGKSNMLYTKIYDHAISTQERNELYKEFLRSSPIEKPVRNFEYPKPTDLSNEVDSKVGDNLINSNISDWVEASATIIDSTSFSTIDKGGILKDVGLIVGKKYKLILDLSSTATSFTLYNANSAANVLATSNGIYEFVALSSYLYLKNQSAGTTSINIFECKELSGLVAAYNMIPSNGTLVDISGNGNDGTINGALSTKDGMKFDGVDDYVKAAPIPEISTTKSFTICARVKFNDINSAQQIIVNGNNGTDRNGFTLSSTRLSFVSYEGSYIAKSITGVLMNKVYTLVGVGINNNLTFYLDGSEITDTTLGNTLGNTISNFAIGSNGHSNSNFFDGEVLDVKIYNRALTSQEAKDYHNSFIKPVIIEDFSNNAVGDTI